MAYSPRRRPSLNIRQVGVRIDQFRGLLSVHSRYGLCARGIACTILSIEGFDDVIASTAAPIATGWSDLLPGGIVPLKRTRLVTAH
jgi:hypothetical protein